MMIQSHRIKLCGKVLVALFCFFVALYAAETYAQSASDSFTVGFQYGIDETAPTVPADVLVTPIAETQIDISWTASTDDFAVAGYQVFRDGVQITTTATTEYSDTGLVASTTYSYTVRAFDGAGNVSSSSLAVATTTFATPPAPPTATSTPDTGTQTGTRIVPKLLDLQISAGAEAAEIEFSASQPVRYVLRYGAGEALAEGIIEAGIYKRDHTIVLQNLRANTTYQYELYVTDRFGRETMLQTATFQTAPISVSDAVMNVDFFAGAAIGDDVVLRWRLPDDAAVAFVRVVRNARFFPQSPTDGEVVYQGSDTAYADLGALRDDSPQYYTIFAYSLSGRHSSGRVLTVSSVPVAPEVVNPDTTDQNTDVDTAVPPVTTATIRDAAITLVQAGVVQPLTNRRFSIIGDSPFQVRLEAAQAPQFTRSVLVTLFETANPETFYTYVLRRDVGSDWYEARLQGLPADTEYSFILRTYTVSGEIVASYEGGISVAQEVTPVAPVETIWQASLIYILLGTLLALLLLALLRFLVGLLFGSGSRGRV